MVRKWRSVYRIGLLQGPQERGRGWGAIAASLFSNGAVLYPTPDTSVIRPYQNLAPLLSNVLRGPCIEINRNQGRETSFFELKTFQE